MPKKCQKFRSTRQNFPYKPHKFFFAIIEKKRVNLTDVDHVGDEYRVEVEFELPPFISLSVMIMLMRMTTIIMMMIMTIMMMIMTIMMMILMIIMMVSMMIMMVMKCGSGG